MAEKNESNNYSREEVETLVRQYELDLSEQTNIFLGIGSFVQIIEYYEDELEIEKALNTAELAQQHYPFSAIFKIKAARYLGEMGYQEEAEELLEVSRILDATETEYYILKSEILAGKGKYKQAVAIINEGLSFADHFDQFDLLLSLSDIHESNMNYRGMYKALKSAAIICPADFEVAERLCFCIDELQNFEEGIKLYNQILDIDPFAQHMWLNLGKCYTELELYEKAVEAYEFALTIDEQFYDALYEKAEAYYELEKYKEALKCYKEALTLKEADEELFYSIAFVYYQLNNHQKALYYFKKILDTDDTYQDAYFQIGKIKEEHGFIDTAIHYYQKAIEIEADNAEYLEALGNIFYKKEDFENAAQYFISLLSQESSMEIVWLQLADCYCSMEMHEEAIQILSFGNNALPESSLIPLMMGIYNWEIGKQHTAIEHFRSALILDNTKGELIFKYLPYLEHNPQIKHLISCYHR